VAGHLLSQQWTGYQVAAAAAGEAADRDLAAPWLISHTYERLAAKTNNFGAFPSSNFLNDV